MGVKNFSLSDITKRIMLTLPSRFSREDSSNVYKFFETISDTFKLNLDKIDEVITQSNLDTASGEYLDQYISGLAGFGRLKSNYQGNLGTEDSFEIITEDGDSLYLPEIYLNETESDQEYRERYLDILYTYNPTKSGLTQIVIDFAYVNPSDMYASARRGSYTSGQTQHSKYFFTDSKFSYYGSGSASPYVGFIELSQRPNDYVIDLLCDHISKAKGFGIKIFLKYPQP